MYLFIHLLLMTKIKLHFSNVLFAYLKCFAWLLDAADFKCKNS